MNTTSPLSHSLFFFFLHPISSKEKYQFLNEIIFSVYTKFWILRAASMEVPLTVLTTPSSLYVGYLYLDIFRWAAPSSLFWVQKPCGILLGMFCKSLAFVCICRDSSTSCSLCYGYLNFVSPQDGISPSLFIYMYIWLVHLLHWLLRSEVADILFKMTEILLQSYDRYPNSFDFDLHV